MRAAQRARGRAHHRATSGATSLDDCRPACSNYAQPAAHIHSACPQVAATIPRRHGVAAAAMRDLRATARAGQALNDRAAAREAACTSRPPCTEEDAQRPAAMRDRRTSLGRHSRDKSAVHACLRAVNPRQRCIDSYMHRGLTQSRRLTTPDESANGSK
ncbi:hypothetical protein F511_38177 [Dorcoceras hygrometricum]|uniref:Uncharacterized protein n=1 Tax=Dorcoceras hygrometricum TaxID=472368 RepID=A0A2Z7BU80_9LAMI|nr:hypothetical protein F511_38177 [Dorcoceras hygrometricum]